MTVPAVSFLPHLFFDPLSDSLGDKPQGAIRLVVLGPTHNFRPNCCLYLPWRPQRRHCHAAFATRQDCSQLNLHSWLDLCGATLCKSLPSPWPSPNALGSRRIFRNKVHLFPEAILLPST